MALILYAALMVMQWSAGTRLMIVGKSGAIVRRGADLASDVVATLPKGSYAEAAGKEQEIVDKGRTKQRLQLLSPVDGWLSSNLVAAADDERPLDRELAVAVDLAERAGASTKEIAELIKTIQAESKNAIVAVERGASTVDTHRAPSSMDHQVLKRVADHEARLAEHARRFDRVLESTTAAERETPRPQ